MINAFSALGLPASLVCSDESLRSAFREAGKAAHPDAGGGEEDFARLREALETLTSPSRRLRHWLEIRGTPVDPRGTVDAGLMDLFVQVGEVTQIAESIARRRQATQSALALALLERETQSCIEAVESTMLLVEAAIRSATDRFPEIDSGTLADAEDISKIVRNLAFLERWRSSLRGILPRLV